MQKNQTTNSVQDFNVIEILTKIWRNKYLIIKVALLMAIAGIITAITTPNSYTAYSIFVPRTDNPSRTGSTLSSLANLAGVDLPSMTIDEEITPILYPRIAESIPFRKELLSLDVIYNKNKMTLKNYLKSRPISYSKLIKDYSIGLPFKVKEYLMEKKVTEVNEKITDLVRLTDEDDRLFRFLENTVSVLVDKKGGFISLTVSYSDPLLTALIAKNVQTLLQEYIINFKRKNAEDNLTFTQSLFKDKKNQLEKLQDDLASFRDQNQNISSGLYLNQMSRMESDLAIIRIVVEELAKQVEQAKIQVNRDTPVFTIIEPVVIPNERSKPNRSLIVIAFVFMGIIFSVAYILSKDQINDILEEIKKSGTVSDKV